MKKNRRKAVSCSRLEDRVYAFSHCFRLALKHHAGDAPLASWLSDLSVFRVLTFNRNIKGKS